MELAFQITRRGGVTITAGLPPPNAALPVPLVQLVAEERTLKGSFGYTPDEFREAVAMLPDLDTSWVHTVPFVEAEGLFTALLEGRSPPRHIKLQMRMSA